jgi:hypothetical protein
MKHMSEGMPLVGEEELLNDASRGMKKKDQAVGSGWQNQGGSHCQDD